MTQSVSIPARFNGPPASGNGGYCCGVLAGFIDGVARVRLHTPPPLEREMEIRRDGDGAVGMYDGELRVGSAWHGELNLDVPVAPGIAEAEAAEQGYRFRNDHVFPTCFVCGPGRPEKDGLELFPGPVSDWEMLACTWRPSPDLLDEKGCVCPEFVWSALDCPGFYAAYGEDPQLAVLGELTGEILQPVPGSDPLVVYAWPLGREGRKAYGGAAVASADGTVLAVSHSTWIELKP